MWCQESTVLYIEGLSPLQEGRLLYCAFCLMGLAVHRSEEAALLTFWDLLITRVNGQPAILKTKGCSATQ